jgi:hypothetical protein
VEWHYELVKNGGTGFVKENDLEALTQAVAYLLDHPQRRKKWVLEHKSLPFPDMIFRNSEMKKIIIESYYNIGSLIAGDPGYFMREMKSTQNPMVETIKDNPWPTMTSFRCVQACKAIHSAALWLHSAPRGLEISDENPIRILDAGWDGVQPGF